jgi:signal transduction histidine kinase
MLNVILSNLLRNAIKHSAPRAVLVHLQGDRDGLVLTVTDDGKGFDISTVWGRGLGLISMQERLDALGGTLEIRSKPGEGTRVEAHVALRAAQSVNTVAS